MAGTAGATAPGAGGVVTGTTAPAANAGGAKSMTGGFNIGVGTAIEASFVPTYYTL